MKKRLTGKPACVAILSALIVISILDMILRGIILREAALSVSNAGESIITALFALMLLVFAQKGKDRLFYICTGGLLFYFVLNQLFGLPAMIADLIEKISKGGLVNVASIPLLLHVFSMLCIVAIGGLLVEYMNDGTIYNKAFNTLCIITVLILAVNVIIGICDLVSSAHADVALVILNNFSRLAMVFLFVFFAYDTAKRHLAKTKL